MGDGRGGGTAYYFPPVPRSLVVGNGNALVSYDANYDVRDIYYPYIGQLNQTLGNVCRTGFFIDGKFAWLDDGGWQRQLGYLGDTLITDVTLIHAGLGLQVRFNDFVDMARDYFIRSVQITPGAPIQVGRVFFHYDWSIGSSDLGCTVLYEPRHRAVLAYKDAWYFLAGGQAGPEPGISSWATGKKGGDSAGTWLDAVDGELGRNPIEQGAVDCTIAFDFGPAAAGSARPVVHWLTMGSRFRDVAHFGQDLILSRGVENYETRTRTYWTVWSDQDHRHLDEMLSESCRGLFRRSIATVRAHADNRGGLIASTDFDITRFARDTYDYVWPRDGALAMNALDRTDHEEVTRRFFQFCREALTEQGYLLHKYNPDGTVGSSWHPWVRPDGTQVLPVQEDETGLVLWALWEHFRLHHNIDFVVDLYTSLVTPAADWMAEYFDDRNGLPMPSFDLWEERWGVHAFTVGAIHGGLDAARKFADLFGDKDASDRYRSALERLREGADRLLYRPEMKRFCRRLEVGNDGSVTPDPVIDSAIYGLWRFGMYAPDEPRIVETMTAIADQLRNRAECGGQARYANDYYFQVERDVQLVPGNPWFICTLWLAQWQIATARTEADLENPRRLIHWTVDHQGPGGLLSEQLDPHSGAPLSVSPLTWSHAELVVTVDEYARKAMHLRPKP